MTLTRTVQGTEVPLVGLGTWQLGGPACVEGVRDALELGYRHIDTAVIYDNEEEVGRAIADSPVAREEIWLTTKVWRSELAPDRLRRSLEGSLERLATDYVDLLLIHWPGPEEHFEASLEAMAGLREEGLIRALGVSNYPARLLRRALAVAPVLCDQVEFHPRLGQPALLELAREHDVLLAAYAPFGSGEVLADQLLAEVAAAHDVTPAQVCLRWLLDQGPVAVLPRSTKHERRAQNIALGFTLSDDERRRIDALSERGERYFNPSFAPAWGD